ncbi:AfsR/SARP family transcriptional regulator [Saccharothrix sp. ST-888]|uniref:AfsR/SARP family transcriptional regulator n=1 Tax=Saccharothrix sp. ST-888 TaxID=1427391 RepID=UPI0006968F9E|nr:AfsR/SARP family transcriptional regulator [Saccharothrix sp. ST-888]
MEFGILGPLQLRDDGEVRVVPAAKQRILLAALLVRQGQVIPAEQLADTVWSTRVPRSAATTLRNYVMRLRRELGRAGERLRTGSGGYVIDIAPDELDAHRFTTLHRRGTDALRRGEPERATALFDAALGLWRGPALVDVDCDELRRVEAERLEEIRLNVLEARLDAGLRLGRHDTLIAELHALTTAHPERERFWGQLMTALHRSGRQAEALAVYRRAHRFLIEEIGVGPGIELRAVHQQVLCADPGPERPASGPGGPVRLRQEAEHPGGHYAEATPFHLPPAPPDFTGRAAETAALTARLTSGGRRTTPVAVVSGEPGIGKSTLAVQVAHAARPRFPDGILRADLRGSHREPAAPPGVLRGFLLALGVPSHAIPAEPDERTALYRSLLSGRRLLVVLDDARDAAQVRPLLPGSPDNAVLVTSRRRLTDLAGVHPVELAALSDGEARTFLTRATGPDRLIGDPRALAALVRACGGLPLALRICAARLAARPSWAVRELADRLTTGGRLLDELRVGSLDIRSVFGGAHDALAPATARAFRLLSLGTALSIRTETAARMLGEPVGRTEQILERLVDVCLLTPDQAGEYRYHDLLRAYAREQSRLLDDEPDRRRAREQAVRGSGELLAVGR